MGRSQRQKGKRGERLASKAVTAALGVKARRGVQYKGGAGSADIEVEIPGIHWEVKFVERESVRAWMKQARDECGVSVPVVLHKRSREEWLVTVPMERLYEFVQRLEEAIGQTLQALGGEPFPSELPLAVLPPGPEAAAGDARDVSVRRGERERSDRRRVQRGGGCDS
jgi:hypothetical protein